jgi:cellulose synthase/poly-beta-1,6-N-acetylglucosamine synthase-like glycosyltransferase
MSGMLALDAALSIAALPCVAAGTYLGVLAACSRRLPAVRPATSPIRFDVVVPAHDEEPVIATTIASLLAIDYPADHFRVTVVADNCSDGTAAIARAAGVRVLERQDAARRGKGHALAFAFADCLDTKFADAIVVVDADTVVSPNLLAAFAARLAAGEQVVQACYGVRDADSGWRSRLMSLAFTLFHDVRSLARERLRLSCGLRGNGMGFTRRTLESVPYSAYSIVEDLEYGIALGMAGVRVAYVQDAIVRGDVPAGERASRTQRERWESGRAQIARLHRGRLLRAAMQRRDAVALDLALDLIVPPLATVGVAAAVGAGVATIAWRAGWSGPVPVLLWGLSILGIGVYVARGCVLAGGGLRVVADLAWAPVYVSWKLLRRFGRGSRTTEWVRTSREAGK